MKFKVPKTKLLKAAKLLNKFTAKTSNPSTQWICMEATQENVFLIANNLEIGIQIKMEDALISKIGTAVVDAAKFQQVIELSYEGEIELTAKTGEILSVKSGRACQILPMYQEEEFLPIVKEKNGTAIDISEFIFKDMVQSVAFSAKDNSANLMLSAVHLVIKNDTICATALDGKRIARRTEDVSVECLIKSKSLTTVSSLMKSDIEKTVRLTVFSRTYSIVFDNEKYEIVGRLVEGQFFNIDKILNDWNTSAAMEVDKRDFQEALLRCNFAVENSERVPMNLQVGNIIRLSVDAEPFSVSDELTAQIDADEEISVYLKPRYLLETLKVYPENTVRMEFMFPKDSVRIVCGGYMFYIAQENPER